MKYSKEYSTKVLSIYEELPNTEYVSFELFNEINTFLNGKKGLTNGTVINTLKFFVLMECQKEVDFINEKSYEKTQEIGRAHV